MSLPDALAASCTSFIVFLLADHVKWDNLSILKLHNTDPCCDIPRHLAESLCSGAIRYTYNDRATIVTAFAHVYIQGNAPKEGHIMFHCQTFSAAHTEQVASHVLNNTQDRDIQFSKHAQAA